MNSASRREGSEIITRIFKIIQLIKISCEYVKEMGEQTSMSPLGIALLVLELFSKKMEEICQLTSQEAWRTDEIGKTLNESISLLDAPHCETGFVNLEKGNTLKDSVVPGYFTTIIHLFQELRDRMNELNIIIQNIGSGQSTKKQRSDQPSTSSRSPPASPPYVSTEPELHNDEEMPIFSDKINSRDEFFECLGNSFFLKTKKFSTIMTEYEAKFFKAAGTMLFTTYENGSEFLKKVYEENFSNTIAHLKSVAGLGGLIHNINFKNIMEFVNEEKKPFDMINSNTGNSQRMTFSELIRRIRSPKKNETASLVLLTFEFSKTKNLIEKTLMSPDFIKDKSLVNQLKEALEQKISKLGEIFANPAISATERHDLEKQMDSLQKKVDELPTYEKYLIISMSGSFNNAHIEFSGSSTFFHVLVGKQVIYTVKKNLSTMEAYKRCEEGSFSNWIGLEYKEEWDRLEVTAGESVLIPPGTIYMAFTPVHSIIFGSYFLQEESLKTHFEISKMEDDFVSRSISDKMELFQNFWSFMISYTQHVFIPKIEASKESNTLTDSLVETGALILKELAEKDMGNEICPTEEAEILKKLGDLLGIPLPTFSSPAPNE